MCKRLVEAAAVVHRLAEREPEVKPVFVGEAAGFQRFLHGGDVGIVERHRLQIREAPPRFAERRPEGDRFAIRGDPVSLPPDRLEHVAVAHPDFRLVRQAR